MTKTNDNYENIRVYNVNDRCYIFFNYTYLPCISNTLDCRSNTIEFNIDGNW